MSWIQKRGDISPSNYYIAIQIPSYQLSKVKKAIPLIPTYEKLIHRQGKPTLLQLCWELDSLIVSAKQFRWVANLKYRLKKSIEVKFEFVDVFTLTNLGEVSGEQYTLEILEHKISKMKITYPKLLFTSDRKELYTHLTWYGEKLHYNGLLSIEELISASITLNDYIENKYTRKELISKALSVYKYIVDNPTKYLQKLSIDKKRVHKNTAKHTENIKKVKRLMQKKEYLKPNQKSNVSFIAESLHLSRQTVTKIVQKIENESK